MKQDVVLLVIGDMHYRAPDYKASGVLRELRKDVDSKGLKFDVVCQLGDIIENQRGPSPVSLSEGAEEWKFALKDVKKVFPDHRFLTIPGNHDWYGNRTWFGGKPNLDAFLLPFLQKETGCPLNGQLFYSIRLRDVQLVFLNHVGVDSGIDREQEIWLEKTLRAADENPAVKHVVVFAHCGLWNVDYFRFNENAALAPLIAKSGKCRIFFAGHLHANNLSVDKTGKHPVLQVVTAGFFGGPDKYEGPEHTLILNPPPSGRGYVSIPPNAPSYCIVRLGDRVSLRMEKIGGGTLESISFASPDEITASAGMKRPGVRHDLPSRPGKARLLLFPYFPEKILDPRQAVVSVNGTVCGSLSRNASFWHKDGRSFAIDVPGEILRKKNTVRITNPNSEHFLLRNIQLEVADRNGGSSFSNLYGKIVSSGPWKNIYMNFGLIHPDAGILYSSLEKNASDEMIQEFPLGSDLEIPLEFSN